MAKKLPKKLTPKVNTSVVVEKSNYGTKEVISEKGIETEHDSNPVNKLKAGEAEIGLSKGLTINLGGYESARVNCWISKVSKDTEVDIMAGMIEISEMIDEQIQFEVEELAESRK